MALLVALLSHYYNLTIALYKRRLKRVPYGGAYTRGPGGVPACNAACTGGTFIVRFTVRFSYDDMRTCLAGQLLPGKSSLNIVITHYVAGHGGICWLFKGLVRAY